MGRSGEVLLLLEGEHRRDESRGSLAERANGGCTTSTVSTRQGIRLSITFLPLASSAEDEELLLGTLEKIFKAILLPEGEALGHLGRSTEAWRYRRQ